jgi:uncharacterized protein (TIGR02172 family)
MIEKDGKIIISLEGRIDSNNAAQTEKEIFDVLGTNGNKEIIFEAGKLSYISSAGLRVLLKVQKSKGRPITIRNVSRDIYEIFETTGFVDLLDVKKAFRKISLADCEKIGRGGHGNVYRLDEETIVKIYHDHSTLEMIEKERMYAKNAFVNGVPSAIAYDIVETEDGYGLVFEMAGATTVSKYIMEHPDKLQEYSIKLGVLLKTLNNTEADPELYGNIKQIYLDRARKAGEFFTDDEVDQMIRMINSIPEGTGMIHGDFHTNNVMVQSDGELILIDMADISRGNPIYDIGGAFLTMYLSGMKNPDITREVIGIDYEMSKQVWGIMLSTYYGTTDPDKLEMISKKIGAFALLRMGTTVALGERAKQSAPGIVTLLRQKLFPNTDALCQLFAMP